MDIILDWLPKPLAAYLRAQPTEVLMLVGGLIMTAIVVVFYRSMRRW